MIGEWLCAGRGQLLFLEDSFKACDLTTHFPELVRVFDLSGLLAHAEVDLSVTGIAELLFNFSFGHFTNIFCAHGKFLKNSAYDLYFFVAGNETATEWELGVGKTECLTSSGSGAAGDFE